MRELLRPFLLPVLRRDVDEVEKQARHFSIQSREGRELVAGVGRAFLGGYRAMLEARALGELSTAGLAIEPHYRPFFFEGAAMGYLPRAYFTADAGKDRVEADLLAMDPRFRYLYYVGLGFWFGFRHPRRPWAIEALGSHLDPFYSPLAYDGFGFKVGFFDFPERPAAREILDRAPVNRRPQIYQGFGRALFFVCMEDEERYQRAKAAVPAEHRNDVESGRSLALAFTGLSRVGRILGHLTDASDGDELGFRLLGVAWALTAREMNDPEYFERCIAVEVPEGQALLRRLPELCRQALSLSKNYEEWRMTTKDRVVSYSMQKEVHER
jgi:hypothetical protein